MKTEAFYDVRNRCWVNVPADQVTKIAVPANLYDPKSTGMNYFLCAKNAQGKPLRKIVTKAEWDNW